MTKKTQLSKQWDLKGKQRSWLSLRADRSYIKLTGPPGPFILAVAEIFLQTERRARWCRISPCQRICSVMRQNLWLQKIKNKKRGGEWHCSEEKSSTDNYHFNRKSFTAPCMQGFHKSVGRIIGTVSILSRTHCTIFPFNSAWILFSFLILARGMKAQVFLRPNSELHKSQATTDSNAIDVDQLPPLHAALCLASLKGWVCFLQAQPFQPNVHYRALWHIQR